MRLDLSGKTALVTGSTQGIGMRERGWGRIRYIASDSGQASATTGGAIRVDGGYVDAILP